MASQLRFHPGTCINHFQLQHWTRRSRTAVKLMDCKHVNVTRVHRTDRSLNVCWWTVNTYRTEQLKQPDLHSKHLVDDGRDIEEELCQGTVWPSYQLTWECRDHHAWQTLSAPVNSANTANNKQCQSTTQSRHHTNEANIKTTSLIVHLTQLSSPLVGNRHCL